MSMNSTIKVKYTGETSLSLIHDKTYTARILKKGWYGIVDESKEEYAFPPELFEIVEE